MSVILFRTHANRWVARERPTRPVIGVITLVESEESATLYRTEAIHASSGERRLLRDSDALEVAFALLLAHLARADVVDIGIDPDSELELELELDDVVDAAAA